MISARGPDSTSADELGIDVRAPAASRRSPDSQTAPPRVGQLRRRRATALLAPRPIPSGIGMTKPTIQQARDRAEVLRGATRPERVTGASSLERLLTGARNGLANVCSRSGVRIAHSNPGNGSISAARMPMIGWLLLARFRHGVIGIACRLPR